MFWERYIIIHMIILQQFLIHAYNINIYICIFKVCDQAMNILQLQKNNLAPVWIFILYQCVLNWLYCLSVLYVKS